MVDHEKDIAAGDSASHITGLQMGPGASMNENPLVGLMIAIIDYKAGNLTSVQLACDALGADAAITRDPSVIRDATRVIFPGDGAAKSAMEHLDELDLVPAIREVVGNGVPFLGICLGTQIILDRSDENEGVETVGLLPGKVERFVATDKTTKIPQMGWNTVRFNRPHPLFQGIDTDSEFYFIHSYYPAPSRQEDILGVTEYSGVEFASIIGRDNLCATQFHPERSGRIGMTFLENFTKWDGKC